MKKNDDPNPISRRRFAGMLAGAGALSSLQARGTKEPGPASGRKIKVGIVGLGHRGNLVGDFCKEHGGYDIHIIDGISWVMRKEPVSACGASGVFRKRHGDTTDAGGVIFRYEDGVIWTHITQALKNNAWVHNLGADFMGVSATAHIAYWGKVHIRGGPKHFVGEVAGTLYNDGIKANVAEFHRCITEGDFSNPTAKRAVDGTITAILGREAMMRGELLTRDEVIREARELSVNTKGLKI